MYDRKKKPWHGSHFFKSAPADHKSILLLKMSPPHPLLWQIESQKCHIPSPWTFFCKQNHSPSIFSPSSSSSTPPSWEHNWLRIKLMFCRGHPVPPGWQRMWNLPTPPPPAPITLSAVISPAKSYHPQPAAASQEHHGPIASHCWCHAAVC